MSTMKSTVVPLTAPRAPKWPLASRSSITVLPPSLIGQRAAGDEAGGDAAGEILQLVAVLVAGDEGEDEQRPQREAARRCRPADGPKRGCRLRAPRPRRRDRARCRR